MKNKTIRDNLEFLEALVPIVSKPRYPTTPIWEITKLTKQLLARLAACEKEGNETPKTLDIYSSLNVKEFQEFLDLLGFVVEEVKEEYIDEGANRIYHVKLK